VTQMYSIAIQTQYMYCSFGTSGSSDGGARNP
jgi:hypothetical protein